MTPDEDERYRRQGRHAALVIAASGLAALIVPFLGLPPRAEGFILLCALAGFAYAIIVVFRLWRDGRKD